MEIAAFIYNSLFFGVKIMIPVLFVIRLTGYYAGKYSFQTLTESVNTVLLTGSLIFLAAGIYEVVYLVLSGVDYRESALVNRISGPYWMFFMVYFIQFGVLPQSMWSERIRKSVNSGMAIILLWIVVAIGIELLIRQRDLLPASWYYSVELVFIDYLKMLLIFIGVLIFVYQIKKQ